MAGLILVFLFLSFLILLLTAITQNKLHEEIIIIKREKNGENKKVIIYSFIFETIMMCI